MGIVIKKGGVTLPVQSKLAEELDSAAVSSETKALAARIDALGEEQKDFEKRAKQIKELQAKQKAFADKANALRDELQAALDANETSPDEEHIELGGTYQILLKKRGTSRTVINLAHLHELLGDDVFYQLASVPLKAVDDYLTPEEKAGNEENPPVLETSRTDRGFTISKRP